MMPYVGRIVLSTSSVPESGSPVYDKSRSRDNCCVGYLFDPQNATRHEFERTYYSAVTLLINCLVAGLTIISYYYIMYSSNEITIVIITLVGANMNPQYKKGVIELCVLSMLYRRDCYGYDVSESISRHINIAGGTVYPILRKLKSNGMVTTYLSEDSGGPPRKYYALTELGKEEYLSARTEWLDFVESVGRILEENDNEQD
jgi:PadR family transcriptional regulator PadR